MPSIQSELDALAALGIDLCQFAAATPPNGITSNFDNPPTFAPAVIAVSVIMMVAAIFFTAGRIYANWKDLTWSDHFCLLSLVFSLGQGCMMFAQLKYVRHQWDIPACWLLGNYDKIVFSQAMLLIPGLFFSKTSLLLLLRNIFNINGTKKYLIWIGIAITFATYFTGIPVGAYFDAPSPGQSWHVIMLSGKPQHAIYWGVVQSAMGIMIDLFIFVLPLPILYQLKLSKKKRINVAAVFSTAFLGVVANVVSLVYRVLMVENTADQTWNLYAVLLCTVVEINLAIIVCSMPGFAKFARLQNDKWVYIASLWSKISTSHGGSQDNSHTPSKADSLMTGPDEPATYRPQEPLAPPPAYDPAPHCPQPGADGAQAYYGLTGPVYYQDFHSPQTGMNESHGYHGLEGAAQQPISYYPQPGTYMPDGHRMV